MRQRLLLIANNTLRRGLFLKPLTTQPRVHGKLNLTSAIRQHNHMTQVLMYHRHPSEYHLKRHRVGKADLDQPQAA